MAVDREVERAVPPLAAAHVVSDDAERLAAHSLDSDFLRTLIEESNRTFFLIDPTTRKLVYISPAFERIWACRGASSTTTVTDGTPRFIRKIASAVAPRPPTV